MSWTEATFTNRSGKTQSVWVHTDNDGKLVLEDGRASMRYNEADDAKVYNAHPRNIALLNGEATDRGASAATNPKTAKKSVAVDDSVWKAPSGERIVDHDIPLDLVHEKPPPAGVIDVWTDGACTGNPGPCGFGVVIRVSDRYTEIGQYVGTGTNNIAELLAIGVALEEAREFEGKVQIHTDSNYSIGVLTKGWKAKANVELIQWIKQLVAQRDVKFIKVKGHAGIPLNERADRLAVAAVERRR